jgi:hypothetical protein
VRRAAAIIKAKIFISYNTAPQYVHPKRVGGKKGKEKGYGQLDGPRAGRRTPPRGRIPPPPSPSASHRLIHGRVFAGSVKKIASFWSLLIQFRTRNSTEFPVGTAAAARADRQRRRRKRAAESSRQFRARSADTAGPWHVPRESNKTTGRNPDPGRRNLTGRRRRRYPQ